MYCSHNFELPFISIWWQFSHWSSLEIEFSFIAPFLWFFFFSDFLHWFYVIILLSALNSTFFYVLSWFFVSPIPYNRLDSNFRSFLIFFEFHIVIRFNEIVQWMITWSKRKKKNYNQNTYMNTNRQKDHVKCVIKFLDHKFTYQSLTSGNAMALCIIQSTMIRLQILYMPFYIIIMLAISG